MSQRAVQERLEQALGGEEQTTSTQPPMLWDMISFTDLEALLVGCCRNPTNRVAISHYVRWMSRLAGGWNAEATLLELLAVLAIAAERPWPTEVRMT